MIKIRTFPHNEKGKIEFTKEELQKLLNEVYNEGMADNYSIYYGSSTIPVGTYTSPVITTNLSTKIDKNDLLSNSINAKC